LHRPLTQGGETSSPFSRGRRVFDRQKAQFRSQDDEEDVFFGGQFSTSRCLSLERHLTLYLTYIYLAIIASIMDRIMLSRHMLRSSAFICIF